MLRRIFGVKSSFASPRLCSPILSRLCFASIELGKWRHGVFGVDGSGRCIFINSAAASSLGYQSSELLGQELESILGNAIREDALREPGTSFLQRVRRENRVIRSEDEVFLRKDGTTFPVEFIASPIPLDDEAALGAVVTFSDITERKDMLRRLAVQHAISAVLAQAVDFEEAAALLIETIGLALEWQIGSVWRVDEEAALLRNVVTWSAPSVTDSRFQSATEDMTFAWGTGLPGQVWKSASPVWSIDVQCESGFTRAPLAAAEGYHSAICFPILRGGDVKGVIEFFSQRKYQPDEELLRTVSTAGRQFGEFIARRKAENSLLESEARKAAIFSAWLDAIIAIDSEGQVLEWNPAAEKIFGYSREHVLGKEMAELIIPLMYRERHRQGIRHYLVTGEGPVLEQRVELTALRADGSLFPVELAITRVRQSCDPTFLGFVRDITDRRKSEQRLLESE